MMSPVITRLLSKVAHLDGPASGAFNIRVNGASIGRASTDHIRIEPKPDGSGLDVHILPGTRNETLHIPVVISQGGLTDGVVNDFHIGEDCEDILIIAGCGIHVDGGGDSRHDGIHRFHIGRRAKVAYRETHYGSGSAAVNKILNPVTDIFMDEGSRFVMDSSQIEGVDSTRRVTRGTLAADSVLTVTETLMTHGGQSARTEFELALDGKGAKAGIVSRSVAKGSSYQEFVSKLVGNAECHGRSECDAIIMDSAVVRATPEITAAHADASLVHEAAIGKIAGEQLMKLMTLGLTEKEAEARIISGFLKHAG